MSSNGKGFPLAVVGAHLRGQPLNHQLTDLDSVFVCTSRTAPVYRLYALGETHPPKPGMVRVEPGQGAPIEVEVWELSVESFGAFVEKVPPPLTIGTIELEDGNLVKGFLCESYAVTDANDITEFGGWRAYLDNTGDKTEQD